MDNEMSQNPSLIEVADSSLSRPAEWTAGAEDATDPTIEDYLDRSLAPTIGRLGYDVRQDLRSEMRLHIVAIMAAYDELGADRDSALALALEQLGAPDLIAAKWKREMAAAAARDPQLALALSRRVGLRAFGIATAAALAMLVGTGDRINYSFGAWILALIVVWAPLTAGAYTGIISPTRPVRASLFALSRILPVSMLAYGGWALAGHFSSAWLAAALFGTMHSVSWLVFGTIGASVGGLARRLGGAIRSIAM